MKKNNKNTINPTKSFLINVLYHVGFKNDAIQKIANVSTSEIEKQVIK